MLEMKSGTVTDLQPHSVPLQAVATEIGCCPDFRPPIFLPDPCSSAGTALPLVRFAIMPHYYFHLYNDITAMDREGRTLPDLDAARANGIKEAREMMRETVEEGRINFSHRIDIADDAGDVAATVTFGEAVRVEG